MADMILGLPSSQKFAAEGDRFFNHRRKILHAYPNGGAALTGLLSMLPEEETNDSIIIWYEKMYEQPITKTRAASFTTDEPGSGDATGGTPLNGAVTVSTQLFMKVESTKHFKPGHIVRLDTTGAQFHVISVIRGSTDPLKLGYLEVRPIRNGNIDPQDYAAGTVARIIGSAYGEGQSGTGLGKTPFRRPYPIQNTTQIFRDHFDFPGSVLQMGLKYDKTGPYREKAKETIIDHMTSIERAILWGQRSTVDRTSFDANQEDLTVRTMSGIEEFIKLWDAGSAGLNVDGSTYNPYGAHDPAISDSDDNKRYIENASGTISVDRWNVFAERVGRYHTNKSNEKLVILGSGAMMAFEKMFRMNSQFNVRHGEKAYGLSLSTLTTPFGDFHFYTHPLFNIDPTLRYRAMILDIHSIKYRPMANRDTRLLKNRQNNGDDFRRDEYLTEATIEFHHPENNMIIENLQDYSE